MDIKEFKNIPYWFWSRLIPIAGLVFGTTWVIQGFLTLGICAAIIGVIVGLIFWLFDKKQTRNKD